MARARTWISLLALVAMSPAQAAAVERPRRAPERLAFKVGDKAKLHPRTDEADRCSGVHLAAKSGGPAFSPGEELAYELTVGGVYIGRFETKVGKPRIVDGKPAISLFGRARTNSFLSTFQKFAGRYMTLVDPETLRPIGLRVEASYGDEQRWEKARFDRSKVAASFLYQGKEGARSYDRRDPLTDVLTMLYFARTRELPLGTEVCQEVFGARWLWRMQAKIDGMTEVDTPAGKKKATRVKTSFQRVAHPDLTEQQHAQKFEMDVYFASDQTQAPLGFEIRTDKFTAVGKLVGWSLEDRGDKDWEL